MSLIAVFQRRMNEKKMSEGVLLDADATADKTPTELLAIVKAQAQLLVTQKQVLQQQRDLIKNQETQLKIQDQLIASQKQKIAELHSKPAKAAPKAPATKPKEAAKPVVPQVEEVTKAESTTAAILKRLFGNG